MGTTYEKIDIALREIKRIQDLIKQGLAKPPEKADAFRIAKKVAELFIDDIFKRKAEKLAKIVVWSKKTRDGFVAADEAGQFDSWIALIEEYKDRRKIKSEISNDKIHVQSIVDGEDQHILITEKGSGEHIHLILDGDTGEIRIDPKDKSPHDLIKSIQAKLELKTGEVVQITKAALSFVEPDTPQPDVKAYASNKDGYFVVEIYNSGDEDLEDFRVVANWIQPLPKGAQERVLEKFNDATDYLVMAYPRSLNMLKQGTRIYANNVPNISLDKKIKITISCKGIQSGKKIEKTFNLETPNQYK